MLMEFQYFSGPETVAWEEIGVPSKLEKTEYKINTSLNSNVYSFLSKMLSLYCFNTVFILMITFYGI